MSSAPFDFRTGLCAFMGESEHAAHSRHPGQLIFEKNPEGRSQGWCHGIVILFRAYESLRKQGHPERRCGGPRHSGKTTLTAGLLFTAGATNRLTRVDEGNTITDFDEEEIQRKITISTAIAVAEWKKTKINLLDTPGFNIFINDTRGRAGRRRCRARPGGRRRRRRGADRKGLGLRRTSSSSPAPS